MRWSNSKNLICSELKNLNKYILYIYINTLLIKISKLIMYLKKCSQKSLNKK